MKKQQLKPGQYTLKPKEIQKLIDSTISFRDRLIIRLLAFGGLRRHEISRLDISFIDKRKRRLHVLGKGDKERFIPLPGELFNDLLHFIGNRKTGSVFPAKLAEGVGLTPIRINAIVADAGVRAKIKNPNPNRKNINPHLLRHSYARALKDKGVPMEFIQSVLGHESIKTTMDTYGLASVDDIEGKFNELVFT